VKEKNEASQRIFRQLNFEEKAEMLHGEPYLSYRLDTGTPKEKNK
jgi:hypothetical protein